ncbi:LiaF transmembrane domain-containing protein [Halobacillus salinus]|uniref:DUF5668 domain-containing protein n=1 Tax=Halobacillus salinus TaxID=192814 RepID=A0A4Z0GYY0_9BACI|nr:hypothetical protein [Halobacillus salinus]TGB01949.1 hypothetical protein E4663_15060 [Halobacillus salinus]
MRKWRVGTVSMGLTLVLLGALLLLSSFLDMDIFSISLTWWPLILVVLGCEVIVYLFLSKQEKPVIHYDFVSIFFIGILGTVGIALYSFTSLGLVEEVKAQVYYETVEKALPVFEERVSDVDKIVVEMGMQEVQLETNQTDLVKMFGRYTTNDHQEETLEVIDVVDVNRVGDTLHIQLLHTGNQQVKPVLSLPYDVDVEVRGEASQLDVTLDSLKADWSIEDGGYVKLRVGEDIDAHLESSEENQVFGEGTHTVSLPNVAELDIYE